MTAAFGNNYPKYLLKINTNLKEMQILLQQVRAFRCLWSDPTWMVNVNKHLTKRFKGCPSSFAIETSASYSGPYVLPAWSLWRLLGLFLLISGALNFTISWLVMRFLSFSVLSGAFQAGKASLWVLEKIFISVIEIANCLPNTSFLLYD